MKIAVLLSGGVDSSTALALLQKQGHELTAFYLKIWLEDETSFLGTCPWQEDLDYANSVCNQLKIPLHVISLQKEYYDTVVAYTLAEIKRGNTPNPDIFCNSYIKFGLFYDCIDQSFDKIATGHYAQVQQQDNAFHLLSAPDPIKDQTYFLAYLKQHQLARACFPLGHFNKVQVRQLAHQYNLPTKNRKDSQGICFLGKLKFNDFIKHYMGTCEGELIEYETGNRLGTHQGYWFHTIGQRKGSGLAGGPWYVVSKNAQENKIYLSKTYYADTKIRDNFIISQCNWIDHIPNSIPLRVKLRHGPDFHDCTLATNDDDTLSVHLVDRDQAITPGQFAVFYHNQRCIGAGVIQNNYIHSKS